MTTREQAEQDLTEYRRVTDDRDARIQRARDAGLTKADIHRLSGISRATIDRVLDKTSGVTEQRYGVLVSQGGAPGTSGIWIYDRQMGRKEKRVEGPNNLTRAMALVDDLNGVAAVEWKTRKAGRDGWSTHYIALA